MTVSNQRRLPRLNMKQVFLVRIVLSPAQSFCSAENRFNSYLVVGLAISDFPFDASESEPVKLPMSGND